MLTRLAREVGVEVSSGRNCKMEAWHGSHGRRLGISGTREVVVETNIMPGWRPFRCGSADSHGWTQGHPCTYIQIDSEVGLMCQRKQGNREPRSSDIILDSASYNLAPNNDTTRTTTTTRGNMLTVTSRPQICCSCWASSSGFFPV